MEHEFAFDIFSVACELNERIQRGLVNSEQLMQVSERRT